MIKINFKNSMLMTLLLVTLNISSPTIALADPWLVIPLELRSTVAPISFKIVVHQTMIRAGDDPDFSPDCLSVLDGPIGMLIHNAICNAQASSRQKHVDLTVGPVREALANYDADGVLVTDIRQAFSGLNWVSFINSVPDRNGSPDELNKIIDASNNPYLGMLNCQYIISGQYDSIWAKCFVEIAKKDIPSLENPADRWNEDFLVFFKQVEVQVGLAHYADDQRTREAQWLTNSAAPLKRAIGIAMESVAKLSARAVSSEQGDVDHWKEAKRKSMGHYLDNHDYVVISGSDNIIKQTGQNCFNKKNKSSIRIDSDGVTTEDVNGNLYICQGFTP